MGWFQLVGACVVPRSCVLNAFPDIGWNRIEVHQMKELFRKLAKIVSDWAGSASAFTLASFAVIVWALTGPLFHFSEDWQLVINTGTTIVTFLMVFLIQNSQNRDSQMIHIKLDELIRANRHARNDLLDLESCTDAELSALHNEFCALRAKADQNLQQIESSRVQKQIQNRIQKR